MSKPPNIILVVADQHRADFLGCAGHSVVNTPHFDAMAESGVRYRNCLSSSPLCMPYRCSLQTGMYSFQHGEEDNGGHLNFDRLEGAPLAERFVEDGYQTAYFGKCHWNRSGYGGKGEYVDPTRRMGWQHWEGWNNGHFSYDMPAYDDRGGQIHPWKGRYEPEIMTERVMRYISEERDPNKPFLVQVNWHPPHNATVKKEVEKAPDVFTTARELDKRLGLGLPEEAFSSYWWFCQSFPLWLLFPVVPNRFLEQYEPERFVPPANLNQRYTSAYGWFLKEYAAMIGSLDEQMGRLRSFLNDSGLSGDTVVIYTSDHGDYLGTNGEGTPFRGKGGPAPESARVPLLIEGPGVAPNAVVDDRPCNTMDLYATLLDIGGISSEVRLRGSSLLSGNSRMHCLGAVNRVRSVFDGELIYSIAPSDCVEERWEIESLQSADLSIGKRRNLDFDWTNSRHNQLHDSLMALLREEGEFPEMNVSFQLDS
ncbi:MAG: sulfatase-like hydrolase/transferase [Puniceicoccales bacterium]